MSILMQVAAVDERFVPRTLDGWIVLVRNFLIVAAAVGGLGRKWVLSVVNDTAQRLDQKDIELQATLSAISHSCAANAQAITDMGKIQQNAEFARAALERDHGRLESTLVRMEALLDKRHEDRQGEYTELLQTVTRIEAQMNLVGALERGLERLADAILDRKDRT